MNSWFIQPFVLNNIRLAVHFLQRKILSNLLPVLIHKQKNGVYSQQYI
jgi:hypothetical protein